MQAEDGLRKLTWVDGFGFNCKMPIRLWKQNDADDDVDDVFKNWIRGWIE